MRTALLTAYAAMPEPRRVVALGDCALGCCVLGLDSRDRRPGRGRAPGRPPHPRLPADAAGDRRRARDAARRDVSAWRTAIRTRPNRYVLARGDRLLTMTQRSRRRTRLWFVVYTVVLLAIAGREHRLQPVVGRPDDAGDRRRVRLVHAQALAQALTDADEVPDVRRTCPAQTCPKERGDPPEWVGKAGSGVE